MSGRLTSGNFSNYYKEGIIGQNNTPCVRSNGSHSTTGLLLATLLPNLMSGVICYAADPTCSGGGSSNKGNVKTDVKVKDTNTTTNNNIQNNNTSSGTLSPQGVANILKKYDVDVNDNVNPNYSDIEIALQQKKRELAELEEKNKSELQAYEVANSEYDTALKSQRALEAERDSKQEELKGITSAIAKKAEELAGVSGKIDSLNEQIKTLENNTDLKDTKTIKDEVRRLKEERETLIRKQKSLRNELGCDADSDKKPANPTKGLYGQEAQLRKDIETIEKTKIPALELDNKKSAAENAETENVKTKKAYETTIKNIEEDLEKLDAYFGKKSIGNQKNNETESIVKWLKKYNNETDTNKRKAIDKEIQAAIEVYRLNHTQGGNPTVDRFIEIYENSKKTKSGGQSRAL